MTTAIVFAYHNVGVRCLRTLLAHGIKIPLVLTHEDDPNERIWYGSVAEVCRENNINFITPNDPNAPDIIAHVASIAPDFLFSFYYRKMLSAPLLSAAKKGALNMHGSLLPLYRGRVPINWAIIHGETQTGATLHYMDIKPDAGDIAAQTAVPILPDDNASEVFSKVTVAAEMTLNSVLPALIRGDAPRTRMDLKAGSYFGGRKPEDGRIDWSQSAAAVHNLVRAVAPPFPGAFFDASAGRVTLNRSRLIDMCSGSSSDSDSDSGLLSMQAKPGALVKAKHAYAYVCGDTQLLAPLSVTVNGSELTGIALEKWLSTQVVKQ